MSGLRKNGDRIDSQFKIEINFLINQMDFEMDFEKEMSQMHSYSMEIVLSEISIAKSTLIILSIIRWLNIFVFNWSRIPS